MANKRKRGSSDHENKKSRKVKTGRIVYEEEKVEEDRLSDLPDHIISKIMAFLPLKEAIRTCILSRRWKDLFCSMSDINLYCFQRNKRLQIQFLNIVDRYLVLRKDAGVNRFSLEGKPKGLTPFRINTWILYALGHGVRELDLRLGQFDLTRVQSSVFTCKTLEKLRIYARVFVRNTLPTNCCLPNLRFLDLDFQIKSQPDNQFVTRLLSSCNSLEELRLCCSNNKHKLSICSPKLKRLSIQNFLGQELEINTPNLLYFCYYYQCFVPNKLSFINLNSLSEASVFLGSLRTLPGSDFMKGISHVQSLHLTGYNSDVEAIQDPIPLFPNLTYMKMKGCFSGWGEMLAASPYLQTLALEFEPVGLPVLVAKEDPSCSLHHVKAIKFFEFGRQHVEFLEYLLKGANVLESLTVFRSKRRVSNNTEIMLVKEIRAFILPKVSKKCKLVIR